MGNFCNRDIVRVTIPGISKNINLSEFKKIGKNKYHKCWTERLDNVESKFKDTSNFVEHEIEIHLIYSQIQYYRETDTTYETYADEKHIGEIKGIEYESTDDYTMYYRGKFIEKNDKKLRHGEGYYDYSHNNVIGYLFEDKFVQVGNMYTITYNGNWKEGKRHGPGNQFTEIKFKDGKECNIVKEEKGIFANDEFIKKIDVLDT